MEQDLQLKPWQWEGMIKGIYVRQMPESEDFKRNSQEIMQEGHLRFCLPFG
jgi:hypothetical protein